MNIRKKLFILVIVAVVTFLSIIAIICGLLKDYNNRNGRANIACNQLAILEELNSGITSQTKLVSEFLLGIDTHNKIIENNLQLDETFTKWQKLIEQELLISSDNFNKELEEEQKEKTDWEEAISLYQKFSLEIEIIVNLQLKGEEFAAQKRYSSLVSPKGIYIQLTEKYIQKTIKEELNEVAKSFRNTQQRDQLLLSVIITIMLLSRITILLVLMTINKMVVKRLRKLEAAATNFYPGKEQLLTITGKTDEIASLHNSMANMMDTINKDTFKLDYVNDRIKTILKVVDKTASGQYDLMCKISNKDDVFNNLSRGINHMIKDLVNGINKIQKQNDWLNLTLGSITDGIIVTDLELCITYMNNAAEVLTGWEMKTVIGKDSDSILALSMEDNSSFEKFLEIKAQIAAYPEELVLTSKSGKKIPIEIDMRDVVDSEQSVWGKLIVFRDISEILDKNKKLVIMQEKIVSNEKLSSIGLLAAGIAHEINNPIGYIQSNFRTLRKRLKKIEKAIEILKSDITPEERDKKISRVDFDFILTDIENILNDNENGINKIHKIVTGMKSFTGKKQTTDFKIIILNNIINEVLKITENESKYIATINFTTQKDYQVECIPEQINQVFLNLILNAIQALKEKSLDPTPQQGQINIKLSESSHFVTCTVHDNGTGIPNEILPEIFNPFFTTKEPGQGTGLGLNVSYNIIKNHGGELSVLNHPGGGAEFTVKLPKKQS